jgi:hypothetical protein
VASLSFIKYRKTRAMAKRNIPRDMGGKTATVIFIEINEKPQNKTHAIIAARALYRLFIV